MNESLLLKMSLVILGLTFFIYYVLKLLHARKQVRFFQQIELRQRTTEAVLHELNRDLKELAESLEFFAEYSQRHDDEMIKDVDKISYELQNIRIDIARLGVREEIRLPISRETEEKREKRPYNRKVKALEHKKEG